MISIISLILSVILTLVCYFMFRRDKAPIAFSLMVTACVLFCGLLVYPLFLEALLVIPALVLWKAQKWRANTLLVYLIVAAAVANAVPVYISCAYVLEMHRLKEKYPFESMADRLPIPKSNDITKLSEESEKHLTEVKEWFRERSDWRAYHLSQVHQDSVQHFVDSPGFGMGRRIRASAKNVGGRFEYLDFPVPQPTPPSWLTSGEFDLQEAKNLKPDDLRKMHVASIFDFANPEDFGLVVSRKEVAGFSPHRFRQLPESERWKIQTVELLGLLMHEEPVIYMSNELPNMKDVHKIQTRPLNNFEAAGLERLQKGDDLFIRESKDKIRMLGAVRSIDICTKCHGGERGDLLGAFSYYLERVP